MKNLILTFVVALVFAFPAMAQETAPQVKDTLEHPTKVYQSPTEMVITAPRMSIPLKEAPFATSIVGSEIMDAIPKSIAADEPLKLVPGVKVDNQADAMRVHMSIRGQGILTERGIRGSSLMGIPTWAEIRLRASASGTAIVSSRSRGIPPFGVSSRSGRPATNSIVRNAMPSASSTEKIVTMLG